MRLAFLIALLADFSGGSHFYQSDKAKIALLERRGYRLGIGNVFGLALGGILGSNGNTDFGESQVQKANRGCLVGERKYKGLCTQLSSCAAAMSDLEAGVKPTQCSRGGYSGICCRNEPRISEKMCDKYKEFFKINDSTGDHGYWCPLPPQAPRIIGGRGAFEKEFPHMVGLGWKWGSNAEDLDIKCGGTLISEEYVLTAAHCFTYKNIGPPSHVILGDVHKNFDSRSKTRITIKIKNYTTHPGYNSPVEYNDIALLQLESKVEFSTSKLPACLPNPGLRHELRRKLTALGWGFLGTGLMQPDILHTVELKRVPNAVCNSHYGNGALPDKYPNGIVDSQLCAGGNGRDTCTGDSGGPLIVTNDSMKCIFHVIGVTNFGPIFCGKDPAMYLNVQHYLDWIEQIVWP